MTRPVPYSVRVVSLDQWSRSMRVAGKEAK